MAPSPSGLLPACHPHTQRYLADRALGSLVRFSFWMLGGAGLALAEAPEADKPRLREEWSYLIRRTISALRAA